MGETQEENLATQMNFQKDLIKLNCRNISELVNILLENPGSVIPDDEISLKKWVDVIMIANKKYDKASNALFDIQERREEIYQ